MWGLIVAKVYEGGRQYSAISELKNAILDAWEKIHSVQLQKIVDSIPSQIFEVIKANGGSTKCFYILLFCSLVLYLCQNKILKLSINANIHIKKELKFLHILNLIGFMPYLSFIWFS